MRFFFVFVGIIIIILFAWCNNVAKHRDKIENITVHKTKSRSKAIKDNITTMGVKSNYKAYTVNPMKTILLWTSLSASRRPTYLPPDLFGTKARKCKENNCYVTVSRSYLDITEFDVVLMDGVQVVLKNLRLPYKRSPRQKYVFATIESSDYYPLCNNRLDGYFNISWTYKLDSDIFYGYITIKNTAGEIIGPKKDMNWIRIEEMKPINESVKLKLNSKYKLAAWFVSNCDAPSGRDRFVQYVQAELHKLGTDMTVDIFSRGCWGGETIPSTYHNMPHDLDVIEREYFFYFSFENSFAEDYVTHRLLFPLQHYTVPVVFGGANYTRFIPDGIYLNALDLGPEKLAKRMLEIAADKEKYYNYFKWINHYSFHDPEEVAETDPFCKFCEAMNDDSLMSRTTVIDNFTEWWNPPIIRQKPCLISLHYFLRDSFYVVSSIFIMLIICIKKRQEVGQRCRRVSHNVGTE